MRTGKALSIVVALLLLIVAIIAFAMSGCAGKEKEKPVTEVYDNSKDAAFVYLNIDYPDESGIADVSNEKVYSMDESISPLTVLVSYGDSNSVEVTADQTSSGSVQDIGGVVENEFNAPSGWVYTVNGQTSTKAAGDYKLKSGDVVTWTYTGYQQ